MTEKQQNLQLLARFAAQVLGNLEQGRAVEIAPSEKNVKAVRTALDASGSMLALLRGGRKPGYVPDEKLSTDPKNVRQRELMRRRRAEERRRREQGLE